MLTSSPSIFLAGAGTGSIVPEELASPRVGLPPWSVGNRDSSGNDDCTHLISAGTKAVSIQNLKKFRSRLGLE